MFDLKKTEARLNAREREDRLEAALELKAALDRGDLPRVARLGECDNHIHSQFSFSPYSPTMIAWKAYQVGLDTCGIVDHESVAGCLEFRQACELFGIAPTLGFEIRLNWDGTPLEGRKFNNPDQLSVGYFPIHGVPLRSLDAVEAFLKPIRAAREQRNRQMVMIHHGNVPEDAAFTEELLRSRFGFENIMIGNVGPMIGTHTGPSIVVVAFLGEQRIG